MNVLPTFDDLDQAVDAIRVHSRCQPRVAIILGSGLSSLVDNIEQDAAFDYEGLPFFPKPTVAGHSGQLILGSIHDIPVVVMQGRSHYYEGYSLAEVTAPVRVLRLLGAEILIVTNAAGAIRKGWAPGDIMLITDHINLLGLAGTNPLRGSNDEAFGPRFPDMSAAYDPVLLDIARAEAVAMAIPLREGVYVMVGGPNFETPAEIRMLRLLGADAVGMSTVPEVIVARHSGMRVLGLSYISNLTVDCVTCDMPAANHEKVLRLGSVTALTLAALIERILLRL